MLRTIVFAIRRTTYDDNKVIDEIKSTADYIRENGVEAQILPEGAKEFDAFSEEEKKTLLIVADCPEFAQKLCDKGFFVVGLWHSQNNGERFSKLKYIFSDLDDIDMDSFLKTYQRYAGEPWEVMTTERLLIRETTLDDIDEFYKIYADPEMTRYMEGLFEDPEDEKRYQKDYIEKVYSLMGFGVWTLIRKEDGRIIGRAGFSVRNGFDEIELGFLIGRDFQRQGYAFEACKAILDYGRDMLLFEKVQTLVKKENEASLELCRKLGFEATEEVRVEENIYGHGYDGKKVELSESNYGTYVRLVKYL